MKNYILITGGLLLSTQVMATDVLGVTWSPLDSNDWEGHSNFTQWITPVNQAPTPLHIAPDITQAVSINTILTTPAALVGQYLTGVGEFNAFNLKTIDTNSETGGSLTSFSPGGELTYAFGGVRIDSFNATTGFTFSGGWFNVYSDNPIATNYNPTATSTPPAATAALNVAEAVDGNLFLALKIEDLFFSGFTYNATTLGGSVNALFSVDPTVGGGGAAAANFNTNTQSLGAIIGDITYGGSSFFSSTTPPNANHDVANGTGDWIGRTQDVPEPAMLSLFGLGMLGLGAITRRNKIG